MGAVIGVLYSFLILPTGANAIGINPVGVGWFLLSVGLLFLVPLAYHAFTIFGLLWGVYEGFKLFASGETLRVIDVVLSLAAVVLVMTSGYLPAAHEARALDGDA